MQKQKTLREVCNGDIHRLVRMGWYTEGMSMYPPSVEGRISKSDLSEEKRTEGEYIPDPIEEFSGLSAIDRRGQASMIRGAIKIALCPRCRLLKKHRHECRCFPSHEYTILEAKMCIPVDADTRQRKDDAIGRIVTVLDMAYDFDTDWLNIIVHDWAGEAIKVAMHYGYDPRGEARVHPFLVDCMRRYAGCGHSTERAHRKQMQELLKVAYYDVLDILDRRL